MPPQSTGKRWLGAAAAGLRLRHKFWHQGAFPADEGASAGNASSFSVYTKRRRILSTESAQSQLQLYRLARQGQANLRRSEWQRSSCGAYRASPRASPASAHGSSCGRCTH
eukprot:scaffold44988_cov67-Phaeocystis_antarctica.AAC.8